MPFRATAPDIAMVRNEAVGKLEFSWDSTGNPVYDDLNTHRVLSLLLERRPSPGRPGWWADVTGKRGSLLYTVKNVRRSTPSDVEAMALDAIQKAVDEGWIFAPTAKAYLRPADRARLEVAWKNPGGRPPGAIRVALGG